MQKILLDPKNWHSSIRGTTSDFVRCESYHQFPCWLDLLSFLTTPSPNKTYIHAEAMLFLLSFFILISFTTSTPHLRSNTVHLLRSFRLPTRLRVQVLISIVSSSACFVPTIFTSIVGGLSHLSTAHCIVAYPIKSGGNQYRI